MAAKATAATSATNKVAPPTIKDQWDAAVAINNSISIVPINLAKCGLWVMAVGRALKFKTEAIDQLGADSSRYVLEPYFGPLQGARLMNALGTNNDCLIHSFLSCIFPEFRRHDSTSRSTMASFFRRFIMTNMSAATEVNKDRLRSNDFLETDELDLLCKHFQVKFVIVKRGQYPVDRQFELVPNTLSDFWTNDRKKDINPFYVIHGSGAHFTPVARRESETGDDKYEFNNTFAELYQLQTIIHDARENDRAVDEVRRSETNRIMREFVNSHYNNLVDLKAIMDSVTTKDEKMAILSEVIAEFVDPLHTYIATLPPQYRRDYADQMAFDYITTTLMGDKGSTTSNASAPSTPTTLQSTYQPDMDLEAALKESIITSEAEKAKETTSSTTTPTGNTSETIADTERAKELSLISYRLELMKSVRAGIEKAKGTSNTQEVNTRVPGESNSVAALTRHNTLTAKISNEITRKIADIFAKGFGKEIARIRSTHGNQRVLRTVNASATVGTATDGKNPEKYKAIVYDPVAVQTKGGKRITKKAKRSKNRKTKKGKKLKK
jgi:hypothetical protein